MKDIRERILVQKTEEYSALRQEITNYFGTFRTVTTMGVILITAEVAGGLSALGIENKLLAGIVFLFIPWTLFLVGLFFGIITLHVRDVTNYIYTCIEVPVEKLLGDEYRKWLGEVGQETSPTRDKVMGWENWVIGYSPTRGGWAVFTIAIVIVSIIMVLGILPGVMLLNEHGWSIWTILLAILLIVPPIVLGIYQFTRVRRYWTELR